MTSSTLSRRLRSSVALLLLPLLGACTQDMKNQPRHKPLSASSFHEDGRASRAPVDGTVARGQLREDDAYYRGLDADGRFVTTLPATLDAQLMARGRERYEIFCSPCHDRRGEGRGMIVRRGFQAPPSFHQDRLRGMPVGYFYDVISNGFGQMSSYASQVPPADRWAIVAHLRALQLSRNVAAGRLDPATRARVARGEILVDSPSDKTHGAGEGHDASH